MKATTLKRLGALEQAANRAAVPPLRLVDVLTLEATDREEYWSGPEGEIAVMTRIGVPVDRESTGPVHTIVIDLHAASREKWNATTDMDDEDLEAFEQRAILEDQRREKEAQAEQERLKMEAMDTPKVRYDYSGYPISDDAVSSTSSTKSDRQ